MRALVSDYQMIVPKNLDETLKLLHSEQNVWSPFAGGTDLMVVFETGKLEKKKFISLWNLKELKFIRESDDTLEIGALATFTDIQRNSIVQREFPILYQASQLVGAIAIQNRATLAGNLANASPAADSSPALLVYEAELELISAQGVRTIPYTKFHLGYKQIDLRPDELIRSIRIPRRKPGVGAAVSGNQSDVHYFRKVGTRRAQAISKVSFAGFFGAGLPGKSPVVRIALGGVAPVVIRCYQTEAMIQNQASISQMDFSALQLKLFEEISPIDDIRSNKEYRAAVCNNLLGDFLKHVELDHRTE